ncbi:MAG: hypothetical protein ACYCVE_08915 [Gemmatimonadaceae bacterium]
MLQYDNVGNVVCQDLGAAAPINFGVDLTNPVNVRYANPGAGRNTGAVNALLAGSHAGYNVGDFRGFQPTAVDSISGFNLATDVTQTVSVNDVTTPATACSIGTPANGCTAQSGAGVLFPATGTGGINDEGYYTVGAAIADRAGNSVTLPGTLIAIDRTAPTGSGGVAIPAALVGGTAVSFSGAIKDNMTLMSGGGSVAYSNGFVLNYDASSSFATAGTFGTFNRTGTATLGVPWFISDLQDSTQAADPLTQVNIRGTDEVGLSGGVTAAIPGANITTGAGTGHGTNGEWTATDYTAFTMTSTGGTLSATVTLPANVGLPFSQVCFYYLDPHAVTTNATPTFVSEFKPTGVCVATAATSDNTHWVYSGSGGTGSGTIIAIGFGQNGHAALSTEM